MPNATLAVGAGLEPAHALQREPRLQRGAIPFRSPYRLNKLLRPYNVSASEQRAAAACNAGGDDPIRTDGAFREHSALAVRCLRPLGHVSTNLWWGWRDLNSHARRHWFLRPACLPFPPHPHELLTRNQSEYTSSDRIPKPNPVDTIGGLPGTRTLKMTQLLRLSRLPIPPEAHTAKSPSISRGASAIP
jgi:hypothetical protein